MASGVLSFNGDILSFGGSALGWTPPYVPGTITFNNNYAVNNVTMQGSPLPVSYPTQLTFLPKVPGAYTAGEQVYFYMISGNNYPGGVQMTYGLYKGDINGWTASPQANAGGAWGSNQGTAWPTGNRAAYRSYSAIPDTTLSASIFRTCLVWDDSYDGIWIDWLHDNNTAYTFTMASVSTAAGSAFAINDKTAANKLFSQSSASGSTGTYNNVTGQYFFWGTKSYLE
jgi:hypothetical protein